MTRAAAFTRLGVDAGEKRAILGDVEVLTTNDELSACLDRFGERSCVLVPTMGGLHPGHASLVSIGAEHARRHGLRGGAVATVFVNPTQFDQSSDFDRYPRVLEADAAMCEEAGASAVYAPRPEDVYPPYGSVVVPDLPAVATEPGLEDRFRPGHVEGVCQVVKRLFELCRPAAAVFGEKDWQQVQVVAALSAMHGLGVDIVAAPLVREDDGLAMSSRNRFLSPADRAKAGQISRALVLGQGEATPDAAEAVMREHLVRHGFVIDYATVRDARTLMPMGDRWEGRTARALITARLGSGPKVVRLLDNAPWPG